MLTLVQKETDFDSSARSGPACDLETALYADVLHLEGRVIEPEALLQQALQLEPDPMAVSTRLDEHVR